MASSAAFCLWMRGWQSPSSIGGVAIVFALGAAIAFAPAVWLDRRFTRSRAFERRFAASFLVFAAATIGVTAMLYAFDYRSYYAAWHDEPFTKIWFLQLAFTTAGALGQFAVTGVRLYFPIGFVALIAASFWIARQRR